MRLIVLRISLVLSSSVVVISDVKSRSATRFATSGQPKEESFNGIHFARPIDHMGYLAWHNTSGMSNSRSLESVGPTRVGAGLLSTFLSTMTAVIVIGGLHLLDMKEAMVPTAILLGFLTLGRKLAGIAKGLESLREIHAELYSHIQTCHNSTLALAEEIHRDLQTIAEVEKDGISRWDFFRKRLKGLVMSFEIAGVLTLVEMMVKIYRERDRFVQELREIW
jgi:hypothetical protein